MPRTTKGITELQPDDVEFFKNRVHFLHKQGKSLCAAVHQVSVEYRRRPDTIREAAGLQTSVMTEEDDGIVELDADI